MRKWVKWGIGILIVVVMLMIAGYMIIKPMITNIGPEDTTCLRPVASVFFARDNRTCENDLGEVKLVVTRVTGEFGLARLNARFYDSEDKLLGNKDLDVTLLVEGGENIYTINKEDYGDISRVDITPSTYRKKGFFGKELKECDTSSFKEIVPCEE